MDGDDYLGVVNTDYECADWRPTHAASRRRRRRGKDSLLV